MRKLLATLVLLSFCLLTKAQDKVSFWKDDTTFNKQRSLLTSGILGVGAGGSITALSLVWYKNIPRTSFQVFNDGPEWLQMDKAGHVFSGWMLAETAGNMYQWSGVSDKNATWIGAAYGFGYLLAFEILDGFAADWGFSWWDVGSNALGAGLYAGQSCLWGKQKIKLKFSASYSPYAQYRPNVLGSNFAERMLKDYNGQTYWISASPGQFMQDSKFPKWLCFSLGYGAEGMIYGQENEPYIPIIGGQSIQFDRYRTLAFSMDIDLSELPVKSPFLRRVFNVLNKIKVPFPAVVVGNGTFKGSWLYF